MTEESIWQQLKHDANKDEYRTMIFDVKDFDEHIKKNCKNQIDIIFDPLVLEFARTDKYYNKYIKKHLKMKVSEYIKIVNKEEHKEKLDNYFKNNPHKLIYNNRVYSKALQQYILKSINNPLTTKSKWYTRYLLNKWQEIVKAKPELKFISSVDYISYAFNWNNKTKLQVPTEALKAVGLSVRNISVTDANINDIYINLSQLSVLRFDQNNDSYLYNLMYTFFHELIHSSQYNYKNQLHTYISRKESLIMKYDYAFYNRHHDYFLSELDANIHGLNLLNVEILSTPGLPFADRILQRAKETQKLHTSYSVSSLKKQVTDYFDQIIEAEPELVNYGLFELEYNNDGSRKNIREFLNTINKLYELSIHHKDEDSQKLFYYIAYNIISKYTPKQLNKMIENYSEQDKHLIINAIYFEEKSAYDNLEIIHSNIVDSRFYDIIKEYNMNRINKTDRYIEQLNSKQYQKSR